MWLQDPRYCLPGGGAQVLRYSTVQSSAVQSSAVQSSAVQSSAVQFSAVQSSAVQSRGEARTGVPAWVEGAVTQGEVLGTQQDTAQVCSAGIYLQV